MSEPEETTAARKSSLDISSEAMLELSAEVTKMISDYFAEISSLRVFPQTAAGDLTRAVGEEIPTEGESLEKLLGDCRAIISGSRQNGHPRFFGYVASPSTPVAAFADLIASTINPNVTSWRSSPAATEIERIIIRWLGSLVGYTEDAQGLLTSGGSMANLEALLIAQRMKAKSDLGTSGLWNSGPPMTVYASSEVHMSIPKAADILGFGRDQVRIVDCDDRLRMDVRALCNLIQQDLRRGLRPFCIVASAGTVNTGAIDPLPEIAEVAGEFDLWFHIDGAYGAFGALDERKRARFQDLNRADSLSLDPHKWLYVPVDCGCLLFRDPVAARAAFSAGDVDYIKVHVDKQDETFAFWDYGVELSRRFRALKIWMTLRYYGLRRIREAISEDNSLTEYLSELIERAEDFELLAPVELSICCFRYVPAKYEARDLSEADLNELNKRIMQAVQRGGSAYISNATIGGKFALRACITNFRTKRSDIDETLEIIRDSGRRLWRGHGHGIP